MDRIDKYKILTKSQIRLFIITKRPFTNESLVKITVMFCSHNSVLNKTHNVRKL